jgi:hypothetical protein
MAEANNEQISNTLIRLISILSLCFLSFVYRFMTISHPTESEGWSDTDPPGRAYNRSLVLFEDGDEISVHAGEYGVRFLLIAGNPLREPVAWYGPIVMNTREELKQAFDELEEGTFLQ